MTTTTSTTVSSHIMSEVLARTALAPLRSKYVMLPLLNTSSIDGQATETRKIPKRTAIAEAVDDTEDVDFSSPEAFAYGTAVELVPTPKVQGVYVTMKALRRRMPGASREAIKAAVRNGSPEAIPFLAEVAEEVLHSHYARAERDALALLDGLSTSGGATNTAPTFAALVDLATEILDNNPDHRQLAVVLSAIGQGRLRETLVTGSAGGIATLFASGYANGFLEALGDSAPSAAPVGNLLGMTFFEADGALMTFANGTTDKVGGIFCVGRGETGAPGSVRGFAEFCEGHALDVDMEFDFEGDRVKCIGRYEWDLGEHTDEHGGEFIFKAT